MLLGERRGNVKREVCTTCGEVALLTYDEGRGLYVHPGCPGDRRGGGPY